MNLPDLSTGQIILAIYDNALVRAVLGLLLANVLAGIASSLFTKTFRLAQMGDFLLSRAVPYLIGAGALQLTLLAVPPEWSGITQAVAKTVWLFVIASLVGHILSILRELGLPVPKALADRPHAVVLPPTTPSTAKT